MNLIDTHCHLAHERIRDDVAGMLARAQAAGMIACICAAGDVDESRSAMALANQAGNAISVYFTAGVHPHEASKVHANYLAEIKAMAGLARNVAVGEVGLDYHYDFSPRDVQRRAFAEQLELACRLAKNVVVHTREAFADTMAILHESGVDGRRVVFHSCTEPPERVRLALDFGAMIGFSGIVTFKTADELRRSAVIVPSDRLLLETDSPYLSPEPVRAMKNNEPANVGHIADRLAYLRNTTPQDMAELTTANAISFFGLPTESAECVVRSAK